MSGIGEHVPATEREGGLCVGGPYCVVEVGHPPSTLGTWLMNGDPERPVCDHHKGQYETSYDDYSNIEWIPIGECSTDG